MKLALQDKGVGHYIPTYCFVTEVHFKIVEILQKV